METARIVVVDDDQDLRDSIQVIPENHEPEVLLGEVRRLLGERA
jgi:hypothetical protein